MSFCFFFFSLVLLYSTDTDKMLDALRDLRVKHLEHSKAKTAEAFQQMYDAAKEQVSQGFLWVDGIFRFRCLFE